jgi:hypothetical protein
MMHANNDPDKFYDEIVMPYKGSLEEWYVTNQNIRTYFSLIGLTVWVVLFPRSDMTRKVFKGIPIHPTELKEWC